MKSDQEVHAAIDKTIQEYGHLKDRVPGVSGEFMIQMAVRHLNPMTQEHSNLLKRRIILIMEKSAEQQASTPIVERISFGQESNQESSTETSAIMTNDQNDTDTNATTAKAKRPLTFAQKLRGVRAINNSLKKKVRKEARKISELNRLNNENDKLRVDMMELMAGKVPDSSPAYTASFKAKQSRSSSWDRDR